VLKVSNRFLPLFLLSAVFVAAISCGGVGGRNSADMTDGTLPIIVTDDISFQAKVTVSYYDENGRKYDDIGGEVNYGDVTTLPGRVKTKYVFDGWLLNNKETPINETFAVTDNVSFYAKFTLPNAQLINTAAELDDIRLNLSGHYILADNISLSEYSAWVPIGTQSSPFTGVLDGNGFKITDLNAESAVAGLFGYISDGIINDLTLDIISVKGGYAGGLAGRIEGTAEISNVYIGVASVIQAESADDFFTYAGGIAGYLSGSITVSGCGNAGTVSSYHYDTSHSGGIAGYVDVSESAVTITNCYNTGEVFSSSDYGTSSSGGMAGDVALFNAKVTIRDSYNTGNVSSRSDSGGITGTVFAYGDSTVTITGFYNTGKVYSSPSVYSYSGGMAGGITMFDAKFTIKDCYNTGVVSANVYSGGIAGRVGADERSAVTIMNCYNTGAISSSSSNYSYSGGIAGIVGGYGILTITNNAAMNTEINTSPGMVLGRIVGGFSRSASFTVANNFALDSMRAVGGNFDETDAAAHGTDKTDVDFRNAVTYSDAVDDDGQGGLGWLFGDDDEYPWKMPASGGYPVLYWQE
jgi:uncharacterized repeat protein (TIGR02543 family)